jgi:hypothetical protein
MCWVRYFLLALALTFLGNCSKTGMVNPNSEPAPSDVSFEVTVNPQLAGFDIPADFSGLSFEAGALTDTNYFLAQNTLFIQYIKSLGPGVIRIGGNSVDKTYWTNAVRTPTTGSDSIASDDIDRFIGFAKATGWKLMFGLNLGTGTPAAAASEAAYVYGKASDQLSFFEIGNEPDLYASNGLRDPSYSEYDFEQEFLSYYTAVKGVVANAAFSGPTAAFNTNQWVIPFAYDQSSKVGLITQHFYQMGPPSDPSVTIDNLMSPDNPAGVAIMASSIFEAAQNNNLGYRIAECNSVYDGGKSGVSNTFASALWAIDFMYTLAEQGAVGVNFHGGANGIYTPIADSAGQFSARPLYYGMLFFTLASKGRVLPVHPSGDSTINFAAHAALSANNGVLVTLINKDDSKEAFVTVSTGSTISSAAILRLQASSLDATNNVSLGGNPISANGSWAPSVREYAAITSKGCTLRIPAGSAVLLTLY